MIEELLPQIYRIEIPLPNNPLKALNSYFIQGNERNLLIDTGFNLPECRAAMDEGMREIGFSMENTDILVTHVHSDHSGLVHYLNTPNSRVFCDHYTAKSFDESRHEHWEYFEIMIKQSGLVGINRTNHPGYQYASEPLENVNVVKDGEVLQVGGFNFRCIETAGHAPAHICLYEPNRKILFSGDHILGSITPNNTIWDAPWTVTRDLLQEYLENLDKVAGLEINITLPGHRETINDCHTRIQELKEHHQYRLMEILDILGHEKMNGAQVARKMKWKTKNNNWEEFAITQKMFATGEALSHLTHLVFQKKVVKELYDRIVYYSLASV